MTVYVLSRCSECWVSLASGKCLKEAGFLECSQRMHCNLMLGKKQSRAEAVAMAREIWWSEWPLKRG